MKHFLSTILIFFFLTSSLFSADRIPGKEGIIDGFAKTEEYTKNRKISKEYRKKTLFKNLTNAVRYTMHKKFPDYQTRIKDLSAEAISFEQEKGTFNYFLNYKEYYIFYNFAVDPEYIFNFLWMKRCISSCQTRTRKQLILVCQLLHQQEMTQQRKSPLQINQLAKSHRFV